MTWRVSPDACSAADGKSCRVGPVSGAYLRAEDVPLRGADDADEGCSTACPSSKPGSKPSRGPYGGGFLAYQSFAIAL